MSDQRDMTIEEELRYFAHRLILAAEDAGFDITIENRPIEPLMMGNHLPVVRITPSHESYRRPEC